MLIQVAMIAFALCAMLSLIIDVGYARITQGQMQNAVDTAAIEGMRQSGSNETTRRTAAGNFVTYTFDDDFNADDGDAYNFGAGPIIDLTGDISTLHGAQVASIPDPYVYKPTLQANLDNDTAGDMVSGHYCYNADPAPSEGSVWLNADSVCGQSQLADGNYARDDFNPGGAGTNAFLVRMRRSNDYQDQGGVNEDVGSSGPSLPLTFGKATTISSDPADGSYSVRRDGLTVRATAIATTRPALHLGVPRIGQTAIVPFDLLDVCASVAQGAPVTISVLIDPVTGVITRAAGVATPTCAVGAQVGRFYGLPATRPTTLRTVGNAAPVAGVPVGACATFPPTAITGYVPVASNMTTGPNRIVGFARATLTRVAVCPAGRGVGPTTPFQATITRAASAVAAANAAPLFIGGVPAGVTAAQLTELLDKNLMRNSAAAIDYAPVLAPMLAR
jgi:hypothetical protein